MVIAPSKAGAAIVAQVGCLPAPRPRRGSGLRADRIGAFNCGAGRVDSTRDQALRDLLAGAPVEHMDATGFRIGGKTQWLHVSSTALLTFYRVCAKRGSLLAHVVGIVVHDHWKPYYTMQGVRHALCNAHPCAN